MTNDLSYSTVGTATMVLRKKKVPRAKLLLLFPRQTGQSISTHMEIINKWEEKTGIIDPLVPLFTQGDSLHHTVAFTVIEGSFNVIAQKNGQNILLNTFKTDENATYAISFESKKAPLTMAASSEGAIVVFYTRDELKGLLKMNPKHGMNLIANMKVILNKLVGVTKKSSPLGPLVALCIHTARQKGKGLKLMSVFKQITDIMKIPLASDSELQSEKSLGVQIMLHSANADANTNNILLVHLFMAYLKICEDEGKLEGYTHGDMLRDLDHAITMLVKLL